MQSNRREFRALDFCIITALCSVFFLASYSQAHRLGNGGDHIRATYIKVGESVLDYLQTTKSGKDLLTKAKLNINNLQNSLDIEKITVVENVLHDNSGSVVEAIGAPGLVTLNQASWFDHFEKEHDVTYLIFHEMLRSVSVNDDNYVISKALNPFPKTLKIPTRVVPVLPLIDEDNLKNIFQLSKININGTGCPASAHDSEVEFNEEKNLLEVSFKKYVSETNLERSLVRTACSLALPIEVPAKKRLVIAQLDLLGRINHQAEAQTSLALEAFFPGVVNTPETRVISSSEAQVGRFLMRKTNLLKSRCGGSDILRINTNQLMLGHAVGESSTIDEMSLSLKLESCSQ
jgi:hypothetical protein